jgi:hypothetical protein
MMLLQIFRLYVHGGNDVFVNIYVFVNGGLYVRGGNNAFVNI